MPIYEFLCPDCGVKFEKFFKSVGSSESIAVCPECGLSCPKVPSAANHAFVHPQGQTRGPLPSNTGTSDDWNVDKTIGRDAAKKWANINSRRTHKEKIIREAREGGQDVQHMDQLVRTRGEGEGAGDYRVIKEPEREVVNARRALADAVAKAATQQSPAGGDKK